MDQTFLFVDLAGFSALTETHGDETGADLVERFVALVEAAVGPDGRLVGTSGDAVFVVAPMPNAGLAVVTRLFRLAEAEPDFPALRAGLHHGEAARRREQFYGTAVNVAARIAAHARGGQALGTEPVARVARDAGLAVRSLGSVRLKNLQEPVEVFSLGIGPDAAAEAIDPVCRMRVARDRAGAHLELEGDEHWFCSRACLQLFLERR